MYLGRQLTSGNYLKLDDISSQFNSSTITFNLTTAGQPFYPGSVFSVLISVGGAITPNLDLTWNQVPINIDEPINFIDIEMQKLFWKSPVKPSKEFIEYFQIMNPEYFKIPSSSIEEIVSFPELVEKYLKAPPSCSIRSFMPIKPKRELSKVAPPSPLSRTSR